MEVSSCRRIIKKFIELNQMDLKNPSPLHYLAINQKNRVKFLIGSTLSTRATLAFLRLLSLMKNSTALKLFSETKTLLNIQDRYGETALHLAASHGHKKIAIHLIEAGANINAQNVSGQSPFLRTTINGKENVLKVLKKMGANIFLQDNHNRTALIWAAIQNR